MPITPTRSRLALCCLAVVLAASCGPSQDQTRNDPGSIAAPPDLADPGNLTVALPSGLPPYGFRAGHEGTGSSRGFAVDLAAAMADRLGVQLRVVALDPQDLLAAGRSTGVDVVIGTTPLTDTSSPPPGFTLVPFLRGGTVLVVRADSAFQPQQLRELCARSTVVVAGTRQESTLADAAAICGRAPPHVDRVTGNGAALAALGSGAADVYVADAATADYDRNYVGGVMVTSDELDSAELAIALRADAADVRAAISRAFYAVHADGSYEVLVQRWNLIRESL